MLVWACCRDLDDYLWPYLPRVSRSLFLNILFPKATFGYLTGDVTHYLLVELRERVSLAFFAFVDGFPC